MLSIPRPTRRARLRPRRWLRHPIPFWIAAVALTALTVATVARVTGAAAAELDRWGQRRPVAVAVRDAEPGELVAAEVRLLPAALVPDGALRAVPDGARASAWIAAGEVVLEGRVAPRGLSPAAALLPTGTRGVAVPQGVAPLPVAVGDRVEVLATTEASTVVVARDALVVAVSDAAVTVAVAAREAADVAYAVTSAAVTLALSGTS